MSTLDYKEFLVERLTDSNYAAGYLSACAEEGQSVLLLGLRDVAEARGGMSKLAEETELDRSGLHRMCAEEGNPRLSSLLTVLETLDIEIQFSAKASR